MRSVTSSAKFYRSFQAIPNEIPQSERMNEENLVNGPHRRPMTMRSGKGKMQKSPRITLSLKWHNQIAFGIHFDMGTSSCLDLTLNNNNNVDSEI